MSLKQVYLINIKIFILNCHYNSDFIDLETFSKDIVYGE